MIQVVDASGSFADQSQWFQEDGNDIIKVVAILGAQRSGKSTLLNKLFSTEFQVGNKSALGNATTKGICAEKAKNAQGIVIFDVEGADARERRKDGKEFQAKCTSLVASLADVLILNLWYHDIGRREAPYVHALHTTFANLPESKTKLLFTVRDGDDASVADIQDRILQDCNKIWSEASTSGSSMTDSFDVQVFVFPHFKYQEGDFQNKCSEMSQLFTSNAFFDANYSKNIPANELFSKTSNLWSGVTDDDQGANDQNQAKSRGVDTSGSTAPVAAVVKADKAFSEVLYGAMGLIDDMQRKIESGDLVQRLGAKCDEILSTSLTKFEGETAQLSGEPVVARKRRELEKILDKSLNGVFKSQLQLIRDNALQHFKSTTASDEMPSDFALFTADSIFAREAENSVRPGSSWSYQAERADLQNVLQELSQEKLKLLTQRAQANQQYQQASQFLQMQNAQMQQMQQQQFGGAVGTWNVNAAYRPPDSNVNVLVGYQQGRTNININMVPDDSNGGVMGSNGFVAGITPANVGMSFSINI